MKEIFIKYLENNPDFSGNITFFDYQKAYPDHDLFFYEKFQVWFQDKKNTNTINKILIDQNINTQQNLDNKVAEFRIFKKNLKTDIPDLDAFKGIPFHDDGDDKY